MLLGPADGDHGSAAGAGETSVRLDGLGDLVVGLDGGDAEPEEVPGGLGVIAVQLGAGGVDAVLGGGFRLLDQTRSSCCGVADRGGGLRACRRRGRAAGGLVGGRLIGRAAAGSWPGGQADGAGRSLTDPLLGLGVLRVQASGPGRRTWRRRPFGPAALACLPRFTSWSASGGGAGRRPGPRHRRGAGRPGSAARHLSTVARFGT